MAGSPNQAQTRRKRSAKYMSHGSKRRKGLELRSGMQGVLVTCEGGKERLSCIQAIQVLERFYDTLKGEEKANWVGNKESMGDCDQQHKSPKAQALEMESHEHRLDSSKDEQLKSYDSKVPPSDLEEASTSSSESEREDEGSVGITRKDGLKSSAKKANIECLLEEEIADLRNVKQARFASVDTGCAGVVFIRMLGKDAASGLIEKGPSQVVEAIVGNCVSLRKPLTRFCLRFLPIEVTCYASAEEVKKMAQPCISRHFPVVDKDKALKFAVVYEARANTSLDRMEIINTVAKLVSLPHTVDLKNPDKTILVQVVKTICAIGVVSKYKQYAKYNMRELTSSKHESKESNQ